MTKNRSTNDPIIVKKYANRRLYDTHASAYVTLDHLSRLVKEEKDFVVQDAKTGEDLTRSVLTQIILEQENKNEGVLPISFLRQIIQFYGESVQSALPSYLELSMNTFMMQQEKWREFLNKSSDDTLHENPFEAQIRRNMSMFEDAMRIFTQPVHQPGAKAEKTPPSEPSQSVTSKTNGADTSEAVAALQQQLEDMQKKIEQLAKGLNS